MFSIFNKKKNIVHCEITGEESTIEKIIALTKMDGIYNLRAFNQPKVDHERKLIHYSANKPPLKFYCQLHVPKDLQETFGDLFAYVEDEDEVEQTTALFSDEGLRLFMGKQLIKLPEKFHTTNLITFPAGVFFATANSFNGISYQTKTCCNWGIPYSSLGKKYMTRKILDVKIDKQYWGYPGILMPGFDVAVGDCAEKNPEGTGYQFKTEKTFTPVDICCNESAVDYSIKNNVIIYYNDFANNGKLRVLTPYTESINNKLQNDYKFRSSNI